MLTLPLFVYGWRATCETCRVVEEQNGMHFGVADDGRDRRADTREGLDALNEAQITTCRPHKAEMSRKDID